MKSSLSQSNTQRNLVEALSREAVAIQKYLFFNLAANLANESETAEIFAEYAEAGSTYVQGSLDFLREIGDPQSELPIGRTSDNIVAAMTGEAGDANEYYPRIAAEAKKEGFIDIASWFENLAKIKHEHYLKLAQMRKKTSSGQAIATDEQK